MERRSVVIEIPSETQVSPNSSPPVEDGATFPPSLISPSFSDLTWSGPVLSVSYLPLELHGFMFCPFVFLPCPERRKQHAVQEVRGISQPAPWSGLARRSLKSSKQMSVRERGRWGFWLCPGDLCAQPGGYPPWGRFPTSFPGGDGLCSAPPEAVGREPSQHLHPLPCTSALAEPWSFTLSPAAPLWWQFKAASSCF